jgi:hypothetical protein
MRRLGMRRLGMGRLGAETLLVIVVLCCTNAWPARAAAQTAPPEAPTFRSEIENFAASLKAHAAMAVAAAQRGLEQTKQRFVTLKAGMQSTVETLRAALSDQKAKVTTLTQNAATTLHGWRTVAAQSWVQMRASAADTLERIADWMRGPSETYAGDETRA